MEQKTTRVGIVMPAINLWSKYTKAAIDSAFVAMNKAEENDIHCHFLLVDNASTDETELEATKLLHQRTDFTYKRNTERWGFQATVNFGVASFIDKGYIAGVVRTVASIEDVEYDYVLVLNNDIILHPKSITNLVKRFKDSRSRDVTITPSHEFSFVPGKDEILPNPPETKICKESDILGIVTCLDARGDCKDEPTALFALNDETYESVPEAPNPHFSAFMLSKECWRKVGEFDEGFAPAYFEDNDYHYRMKLADLEAIVYPPALFFHYGSRTQNESQEDGKSIVPPAMFENNRSYFIRKWGSVPGQERFNTPFNDPSKTIDWTEQGKLLVSINPIDMNEEKKVNEAELAAPVEVKPEEKIEEKEPVAGEAVEPAPAQNSVTGPTPTGMGTPEAPAEEAKTE